VHIVFNGGHPIMENVPTAAAQVIVTVIPIVGIVMGCIVIILYLFWNHQQKILLIEKNLYKKPDIDIDSFSLFAGLITSGVGISLALFYLIKEGISYGMLSGLIPLSVGISLIVFFIVRIRMGKRNNE